MNYTKTNPFRLHHYHTQTYFSRHLQTHYTNILNANGEDRQKCNKCGWSIYIGLEDYYYRESINHNSTQAWLHKQCFGRQKQ